MGAGLSIGYALDRLQGHLLGWPTAGTLTTGKGTSGASPPVVREKTLSWGIQFQEKVKARFILGLTELNFWELSEKYAELLEEGERDMQKVLIVLILQMRKRVIWHAPSLTSSW